MMKKMMMMISLLFVLIMINSVQTTDAKSDETDKNDKTLEAFWQENEEYVFKLINDMDIDYTDVSFSFNERIPFYYISEAMFYLTDDTKKNILKSIDNSKGFIIPYYDQGKLCGYATVLIGEPYEYYEQYLSSRNLNDFDMDVVQDIGKGKKNVDGAWFLESITPIMQTESSIMENVFKVDKVIEEIESKTNDNLKNIGIIRVASRKNYMLYLKSKEDYYFTPLTDAYFSDLEIGTLYAADEIFLGFDELKIDVLNDNTGLGGGIEIIGYKSTPVGSQKSSILLYSTAIAVICFFSLLIIGIINVKKKRVHTN